jgi:hypothetical protein
VEKDVQRMGLQCSDVLGIGLSGEGVWGFSSLAVKRQPTILGRNGVLTLVVVVVVGVSGKQS